VTKDGGVVVVIIGDGTRQFAKSLTSFRLAVSWVDEIGWKLFERAIRKPDLWYHDGDHAVLMRSNFVCHDVRFDPIQPRMRPI
jgi:hypothetical protein